MTVGERLFKASYYKYLKELNRQKPRRFKRFLKNISEIVEFVFSWVNYKAANLQISDNRLEILDEKILTKKQHVPQLREGYSSIKILVG
ncbi:hypothetical protein MNBD_IGNAVI01-1069 [hydrothermal vent metagenome]|uniref:Uncharacterized protein n=1 Tax=hydrothermal vent metagenome TaxID=652676 RepID=A0A3B1C571_9ZZZZ